MRRTASVLLAALTIWALPTIAHAGGDQDGDARQDKLILNANGAKGHDLGGNTPIQRRRKSGWGSGCQATGWDDPLNMPVTHLTVNNYQLHARWCVNNGQITSYSVWPENGPSAPFTHWQYDGTSARVVNTYNDRIYARMVGDYEFCVAWILPYCVTKKATVHITVYSYNRRPDEGGSFSNGWSA